MYFFKLQITLSTSNCVCSLSGDVKKRRYRAHWLSTITYEYFTQNKKSIKCKTMLVGVCNYVTLPHCLCVYKKSHVSKNSHIHAHKALLYSHSLSLNWQPCDKCSCHRHTCAHIAALTTSRNTTARNRLMSTSCSRRSGSLMGDRLLGTVSMGD